MNGLVSGITDIEQMTDKQTTGTCNVSSVVAPGGAFSRELETLSNERAQRQLLIARNPGICGGEPIIRGTRISVANIVELHHLLGWDIRRIREEYPLTYQQVLAALEYYEEHAKEIDGYLQQEKEADEE